MKRIDPPVTSILMRDSPRYRHFGKTLGVSLHETPQGPLRAAWTEIGLCHVGWGLFREGELEASPFLEASQWPHVVRGFQEILMDYFSGMADRFIDVPLDGRLWTPFFSEVYDCCRAIPAGETQTYAQLARSANRHAASRAVGQAMARNPIPLVIPCHRVLATGGGLGGYSGPGGIVTKQWLLAHEVSMRGLVRITPDELRG